MQVIIGKIFSACVNDHKRGLLFIFFLVLVSHGNIFQNQFVIDDFDFIVDWPLIQDWSHFPQFFINYTPPVGQEGIYSPLKTVFHAVAYQCFGLNLIGHHLLSLIVHFTGIYFVYKICLLLSTSTFLAFVSSLIFALHPVQVEAVTYMTASIDMIGIVFMFAAFYWYIKGHQEEYGLNHKPYIISLVFSLVAVFTHELAISLPLLFLWYELSIVNKFKSLQKNLVYLIPFFAIVVFYVLAKFLVLKDITRGSYLYDSFYLTLLVTIKAWAKYVFICFIPAVLTHNHIISKGISSFDPNDFDVTTVLSQSIFDRQVLLSIFVLGCILYFAIKLYRRQPIVAFCVGWFFISLLPVSNIIPSGVYFGERYLYPGMLGFSLLIGSLIERLYMNPGTVVNIRKTTLSIILIISIIGAFSIRTWTRNEEWHDEITLFESTVKANPQSALMRTDLGLIYSKYGRPDLALESFQFALNIKPDDPVIYFSMADAFISLDQLDEALKALKRAIAIDPSYPEAYYNLAGVYAALGTMDKAKKNLDKAIYFLHAQGRTREAQEYEYALKSYFDSL